MAKTQNNHTFRRLLKLILPHWRYLLLGTLLGSLTVLANIGLLGTSAVLLSTAALMPPILDLMVLIVGVRFFGTSRGAFRYAERYVTHDLTFRLLRDIRVWFYEKLEPLAPGGLQTKNSGQLLAQMVADVDTLKFFYLRVLAAPLVAVVVLLVSGLFLWQFSPPAAVVLSVFYLLAGVLLPWWVRRCSKAWQEPYWQQQSSLYGKLVEYCNGLGDLLCFQQQRRWKQEILTLQQSLAAKRLRVQGLHAVAKASSQYLANLALLAALIFTIPLVASGKLPGIYLAMVVLVVWAAFEAVLPLPEAAEEYGQCMTAAGHLFSVIDQGQEAGEQQATVMQSPEINGPLHLKLEQVSFGYEPGQPVLQDICLDLPPGKKLAVVGASGSGKTSLANLLLKFYDYQGSITLAGQELRNLPGQWLRQQMAYVDQSAYLFHATVEENLLLAKPAATPAEVEQACRLAGFWQVAEGLPLGLQTVIGQNGQKLSGGQRQRLALARAFLRQSPILLLDEAAQGLDYLTRSQVMQAVGSFTAGRTLILITHSLSGLQEMDEIIVLEQGRIVERGTEAQLLQKQGHYAKLWQLEHQMF